MPLEEAQDLGFGENFRHADPLWNAEVCFILQQHLKDRENPASTLKGTPVNAMVHKTLDYVRKLNNYATKENLTMSQELFKKSRKFTQYESTLINNLNIGSVDEAFTLIPSLRDKFPQTEQLAQILENFQDYQKHDDSYGYSIHDTSYLDESELNNNEMMDSNNNDSIIKSDESHLSINNSDKQEIDDEEEDFDINNMSSNNNSNNNDSGVGMYSPDNNDDINVQTELSDMQDNNENDNNSNNMNDESGEMGGMVNDYTEQQYGTDETLNNDNSLANNGNENGNNGDVYNDDSGENIIDID